MVIFALYSTHEYAYRRVGILQDNVLYDLERLAHCCPETFSEKTVGISIKDVFLASSLVPILNLRETTKKKIVRQFQLALAEIDVETRIGYVQTRLSFAKVYQVA
jgi:hypothetical protein